MSRTYLYIVIVAVVVLYIYGYYKYPENVSMLQTDNMRLKPAILLERQPVVVQDPVPDVQRRLFRFSVTQAAVVASTNWTQSPYKYLYIVATNAGAGGAGGVEVLICPPNTKMTAGVPCPETAALIAVQLRQGQSLILPFRWRYFTAVPDVTITGYHDIVTWSMSAIMR